LEDRLTIGPCVINYPRLFVPEGKMGSKEPPYYYSAEFIFFTETPDQMAIAQAAYQKLMLTANTVAQHKFKRNADQLSNAPVKTELKKKGGEWLSGLEGRQGIWIRASTLYNPEKPHMKPGVFTGNPPQAVVDPAAVYSGAIVYVSLTAGDYNQSGNQGIKWYLNHVLKVGDGPRLVGERSGADDFAGVLSEIPVTPVAHGIPTLQMPQPAAPVYSPPTAPPGYSAPPAYPPQAYGQPAAAVPPAFAPPQQYGAPPQGYAQPAYQQPPMPGFPQQ
jgi:hypothetical protein